jgi:hypothetical protein
VSILKLIADSLAFASLCCLSVPAWHVNRYARLAARITLNRVRLADPELARRHRALLEKLQRLRDEWKPWKAWCLHVGTSAGLLAALLTVVVSLRETVGQGH